MSFNGELFHYTIVNNSLSSSAAMALIFQLLYVHQGTAIKERIQEGLLRSQSRDFSLLQYEDE